MDREINPRSESDVKDAKGQGLPPDWESVLSDRGQSFFEETTNLSTGPLFSENDPMAVVQEFLASEAAAALRHGLYESLYPLLESGDRPILESAMTDIDEVGDERLPKSYHLKGHMLDDENSEAYQRASELGLIALLESDRLRRVAEGASGQELVGPVGREVLCYEHEDYSGPHTDYHPNDPNRKDGYVDVHITLCNPQVDQQLLVYEADGHLNRQARVGVESAVSLSQLPFWHYTTPLVGKPGHENEARRWLLLTTYEPA